MATCLPLLMRVALLYIRRTLRVTVPLIKIRPTNKVDPISEFVLPQKWLSRPKQSKYSVEMPQLVVTVSRPFAARNASRVCVAKNSAQMSASRFDPGCSVRLTRAADVAASCACDSHTAFLLTAAYNP